MERVQDFTRFPRVLPPDLPGGQRLPDKNTYVKKIGRTSFSLSTGQRTLPGRDGGCSSRLHTLASAVIGLEISELRADASVTQSSRIFNRGVVPPVPSPPLNLRLDPSLIEPKLLFSILLISNNRSMTHPPPRRPEEIQSIGSWGERTCTISGC